jgi:large subunit ribosomal protein L28
MPSKIRVTNRTPQFGQARSKAFNTTKRLFKLNMQTKRYFVPEIGRTVRVKVTTSDMKTIDKIGIVAYLKKNGFSLNQLLD